MTAFSAFGHGSEVTPSSSASAPELASVVTWPCGFDSVLGSKVCSSTTVMSVPSIAFLNAVTYDSPKESFWERIATLASGSFSFR